MEHSFANDRFENMKSYLKSKSCFHDDDEFTLSKSLPSKTNSLCSNQDSIHCEVRINSIQKSKSTLKSRKPKRRYSNVCDKRGESGTEELELPAFCCFFCATSCSQTPTIQRQQTALFSGNSRRRRSHQQLKRFNQISSFVRLNSELASFSSLYLSPRSGSYSLEPIVCGWIYSCCCCCCLQLELKFLNEEKRKQLSRLLDLAAAAAAAASTKSIIKQQRAKGLFSWLLSHEVAATIICYLEAAARCSGVEAETNNGGARICSTNHLFSEQKMRCCFYFCFHFHFYKQNKLQIELLLIQWEGGEEQKEEDEQQRDFMHHRIWLIFVLVVDLVANKTHRSIENVDVVDGLFWWRERNHENGAFNSFQPKHEAKHRKWQLNSPAEGVLGHQRGVIMLPEFNQSVVNDDYCLVVLLSERKIMERSQKWSEKVIIEKLNCRIGRFFEEKQFSTFGKINLKNGAKSDERSSIYCNHKIFNLHMCSKESHIMTRLKLTEIARYKPNVKIKLLESKLLTKESSAAEGTQEFYVHKKKQVSDLSSAGEQFFETEETGNSMNSSVRSNSKMCQLHNKQQKFKMIERATGSERSLKSNFRFGLLLLIWLFIVQIVQCAPSGLLLNYSSITPTTTTTTADLVNELTIKQNVTTTTYLSRQFSQAHKEEERLMDSMMKLPEVVAASNNYRWPFIGLVSFIFVGATGNILVCAAVWRERRLQTATNYFLLSLAIADLLVCTLVMPFGIIYEFYGQWPFDWRICNLWVTWDVLTCSSSILHMCFISVGRYLGIRNPLHVAHRQANLFVSRRAVLWRIALAWISAALIASPLTMMSLYDHRNIIPSETECAISNKYFLIFGSMLAFFIPMFVMVWSYIMTVRLLSQRAKYVRNNSLLLTHNNQTNLLAPATHEQNNNNNSKTDKRSPLEQEEEAAAAAAAKSQLLINSSSTFSSSNINHPQSSVLPSRKLGSGSGSSSNSSCSSNVRFRSDRRSSKLRLSWLIKPETRRRPTRFLETPKNHLKLPSSAATSEVEPLNSTQIGKTEKTGSEESYSKGSCLREAENKSKNFYSITTTTNNDNNNCLLANHHNDDGRLITCANNSEQIIAGNDNKCQQTENRIITTSLKAACEQNCPTISGNHQILSATRFIDDDNDDFREADDDTLHHSAGEGEATQIAVPVGSSLKQLELGLKAGLRPNADSSGSTTCCCMVHRKVHCNNGQVDSTTRQVMLVPDAKWKIRHRSIKRRSQNGHKVNLMDSGEAGEKLSSQKDGSSFSDSSSLLAYDQQNSIKNPGENTAKLRSSPTSGQGHKHHHHHHHHNRRHRHHKHKTRLKRKMSNSTSILLNNNNNNNNNNLKAQHSPKEQQVTFINNSGCCCYYCCCCHNNNNKTNSSTSENKFFSNHATSGERNEHKIVLGNSKPEVGDHDRELAEKDTKRRNCRRDVLQETEVGLELPVGEEDNYDETTTNVANKKSHNHKHHRHHKHKHKSKKHRHHHRHKYSSKKRECTCNKNEHLPQINSSPGPEMRSDLSSQRPLSPEMNLKTEEKDCPDKKSADHVETAQPPPTSGGMRNRSATFSSSVMVAAMAAIPTMLTSTVVPQFRRRSTLADCHQMNTKMTSSFTSANSSSTNNQQQVAAEQGDTSGLGVSNSNEPQMIRYLGSSMQVRSEQKATKVLGVVFFTFVICWSPFFVINFTQAFVERQQLAKWISNEMMTTFLWLGYISSTINPVIYTVFNRNFRNAFRQILLCQPPASNKFGIRPRASEMNRTIRINQFNHNNSTLRSNQNGSHYLASSEGAKKVVKNQQVSTIQGTIRENFEGDSQINRQIPKLNGNIRGIPSICNQSNQYLREESLEIPEINIDSAKDCLLKETGNGLRNNAAEEQVQVQNLSSQNGNQIALAALKSALRSSSDLISSLSSSNNR